MIESKFPRLLIVGYLTTDINIRPGKTIVSPGGGAYFTALAAAQWLTEIGLVARVGADYDLKFLGGFVNTLGVKQVLSGTTTLTYPCAQDTTKRQITIDFGVATALRGRDVPQFWLNRVEWIHLSTMQPDQQLALVKYFKKYAPQAKLAIDTDSFLLAKPDQLATIGESFKRCDLIFLNRQENDVLGWLVQRVPEAVVKLDHEGAKYFCAGQLRARATAPKVKVVDATGAGDIFAGVFLAQQLIGHSPATALTCATAVATTSVRQNGITHILSKKKGFLC